MGLGRKGIFLSLSAILLVGVLFVVFSPATQRELAQDSRLHVQNTLDRVETLETNELPVWVEFNSRQTLNQLARHAASGAQSPYMSVAALQSAFSSCIVDSTDCGQFGPGTTVGETSQRVVRSATDTLTELETFYQESLGYESFSIDLQSIDIAPAGFRAVLVDATFSLDLNDVDNRMELSRELSVQRLVPISGLIDPLAIRYGKADPRITFAPGVIRTVDDFFIHANEGTYVGTNASYPGIPYLERFIRNPEPRRVNSIHFVFPPGHYTTQRDHIDFRNPQSTSEHCLIGLLDETGGWIYIDSTFTPVYGLQGREDLATQPVSVNCD